MYCSKCGAKIGENTNFCPSCGAGNQLAQTVNQPPAQPVVVNVVNNNSNTNTNNVGYGIGYAPKSRWAAFFLCLFLGYFGAHKFYLGKSGMGVLYLLTVGLFGVGWAIDTIILLFGGSRDKWGRPLQ